MEFCTGDTGGKGSTGLTGSTWTMYRRRRSVHNHTWPRPEVCRVRCGTAKPTNLGLSSLLVKSYTNSVISAGILFSSQPTMASPVKRALPRTGPIRGPPGGHLLPLDHTSFGTKN